MLVLEYESNEFVNGSFEYGSLDRSDLVLSEDTECLPETAQSMFNSIRHFVTTVIKTPIAFRSTIRFLTKAIISDANGELTFEVSRGERVSLSDIWACIEDEASSDSEDEGSAISVRKLQERAKLFSVKIDCVGSELNARGDLVAHKNYFLGTKVSSLHDATRFAFFGVAMEIADIDVNATACANAGATKGCIATTSQFVSRLSACLENKGDTNDNIDFQVGDLVRLFSPDARSADITLCGGRHSTKSRRYSRIRGLDTKFNIRQNVKRPLCIIVNIKHFNHDPDGTRKGSDADVDALVKAFAHFNHRFEDGDSSTRAKQNAITAYVKYDWSARQLRKGIKSLVKTAFDQEQPFDAAFVVIMSHGTRAYGHDYIISNDNYQVNVDEIAGVLCDRRCPQLARATKFVFVVASALNVKFFDGIPYELDDSDYFDDSDENGHVGNSTRPYRAIEDTFVFWSALPGFRSLRCSDETCMRACEALIMALKTSRSRDFLDVISDTYKALDATDDEGNVTTLEPLNKRCLVSEFTEVECINASKQLNIPAVDKKNARNERGKNTNSSYREKRLVCRDSYDLSTDNNEWLGYCLVINNDLPNENFMELKMITEFFRAAGFTVEVRMQLTAREVLAAVREFAGRDAGDTNVPKEKADRHKSELMPKAFVVVIFGFVDSFEGNILYGIDGEPVAMDLLEWDATNCSDILSGKPKIFLNFVTRGDLVEPLNNVTDKSCYSNLVRKCNQLRTLAKFDDMPSLVTRIVVRNNAGEELEAQKMNVKRKHSLEEPAASEGDYLSRIVKILDESYGMLCRQNASSDTSAVHADDVWVAKVVTQ